MSDEKEKSPNAAIDRALKHLMKSITPKKGAEETALSPDEIRASVAVVTAAMKWEQTKHKIKDGEEFNPEAL